MYDFIIVGGGPAGITAGIYAARKKLNVLLVTSDFIGQVGITGPIENWPGEPRIKGAALIKQFEEHLRKHTIDIVEEDVVSIEKEADVFSVQTESSEQTARAVLLATGRTPRFLEIPGEREYIGKGVVYCATCDAPIYQNKKVVIVGGGNNGFSSAIELTDYASEVTLLEVEDTCPADEILQEGARHKGVTVITSQTITGIFGDEYVNRVELRDGSSMAVDGVFVEIGSLPSSAIAPANVKRNTQNEIEIDQHTCATNLEGFFAAGDVTDIKDKQIVTATGEGAKAALSAYAYLRKL